MVIYLFYTSNIVHTAFWIPHKPTENLEEIYCAYEHCYWIWWI